MVSKKKSVDEQALNAAAQGQEGAFYLIVLTGLGLAGASVFTLYKLSLISSLCLGAFVLFACVLFAVAGRTSNPGGIRTCLGFAIALALLMTPLVFVSHAFAFPVLAWPITALYWLALLVGLWKELRGLLKALAGLTAAAMPTALLVLPTPDGAIGPIDDSRKWTVVVTAVDAEGEPIASAAAHCAAVMVWERGRGFEAEPEWYAFTDEDGRAEFSFTADTRLKAALCAAAKTPRDGEDGYAMRTGYVLNPFRGGEFPVRITLDERVPAPPQD